MLTTKEVRTIINKYRRSNCVWDVWTNKTQHDTSKNRRVKCYYTDIISPELLLRELYEKTGQENVKITKGSNRLSNIRIPGIIVNCLLG